MQTCIEWSTLIIIWLPLYMLCYFSIAVISGLKSLRNLKVHVNHWDDFQLKLLTALQVCDSIGIRMFPLFLIFLTYFHLTQTLLLHGNLISSLEVIKEEVARTVCTLSLADNDISDLNEVHCLEYMNIYMHTKNWNNQQYWCLSDVTFVISDQFGAVVTFEQPLHLD